jgi:hypothetical protein
MSASSRSEMKSRTTNRPGRRGWAASASMSGGGGLGGEEDEEDEEDEEEEEEEDDHSGAVGGKAAEALTAALAVAVAVVVVLVAVVVVAVGSTDSEEGGGIAPSSALVVFLRFFGWPQSLSKWLLMNATATDAPQHGQSMKLPLVNIDWFEEEEDGERLPSHRSMRIKFSFQARPLFERQGG